MNDSVKHPSHYTSGDVECIDAIKSVLGPEAFLGFLWGNAIKYLWRWPRKGLEEDLEKCEEYIERIKEEGYAERAVFDIDSGGMIPNPLLAFLDCGDSVNDAFAEMDKF
ncbi:MAG: DUF3310 domain-containing protein [Eggerthellaceae bacterium]|nr:DUF3310 domain-containing protein [Eggerthellaceae bacterium]